MCTTPMEGSSKGGASSINWSESVEDLVLAGEIDEAISILESVVSRFEKEIEGAKSQNITGISSSSLAYQLATALHDLYRLYSSKGLSLKADQTLSRALQIKQQISIKEAEVNENLETRGLDNEIISSNGDAEDDWEAVADRAPEELLVPQCLPGIWKLSLEDSKVVGAKRRGRGTFSYKKQGMYSDNQSDEAVISDGENNSPHHTDDIEKRNCVYGTHHVLVLADFPTSTRTTDLEKVLEKFKDRFVIRWVNDTVALAVFKTPSVALEAHISIRCPYAIRILNESDELMSSILPKDLEPPRQRPQTSARTAQRMIAQGMGIKLPSKFESTELWEQEEAWKYRNCSRQSMRDDAWGYGQD